MTTGLNQARERKRRTEDMAKELLNSDSNKGKKAMTTTISKIPGT
jgi:hypothetical protein